MIYPELKEREFRFFLSLKIAIPFILVVFLLIFIFYKNENLASDDIILFSILVLCYVYYVIYLIYIGFKRSVLDEVSKVFNRSEIIKLMHKTIKGKKVKNIVLLKLNNLDDINKRYSNKKGDEIIFKFMRIFEYFMQKQGFKNIPIGKFFGGNYIFIIDCEKTKLEHYLSILQRKLINSGIDKIEIKFTYSMILSDYDKNIKNILNILFSRLNSEDKDNQNIIKPDIFNDLVKYSIDNMEFDLKLHKMKSLKNNNDKLMSVNVKLDSSEIGSLSKAKIQTIANQLGYEIKLDQNIISKIFNKIKVKNCPYKIFIEISPVTLRNNSFKLFLERLINLGKIDPKKIVFEFYEKTYYDEINRFKEILWTLKELGFSFALNQFGGENASFEYFKKLPIDYIIYDIDINKTFYDEKINKLIKHFNSLTEEIGVKTIIRFIDKKTFYEDALKMNFDYIQGFYYEKPFNIELLKEKYE